MVKEHALLDYLHSELGLKNDRQLSKHLGVLPPVLSKIRNNKMAVSAHMILLIYKKTGISIEKIEELIGKEEK